MYMHPLHWACSCLSIVMTASGALTSPPALMLTSPNDLEVIQGGRTVLRVAEMSSWAIRGSGVGASVGRYEIDTGMRGGNRGNWYFGVPLAVQIGSASASVHH